MLRKMWAMVPWIPVAWCADDVICRVRLCESVGVLTSEVNERNIDYDDDDDFINSGKKGKIDIVNKNNTVTKKVFVMDRVTYRFGDIERGDCVYVPKPGSSVSKRDDDENDGGKIMEVQRVVAVENDHVAWRTRDGKAGDMVVPKGHCYVASEVESVESVGCVPCGLIDSKVSAVLFPEMKIMERRIDNAGIAKLSERVVVRRRYF